jgi:hypothetical protein
MVQLGGRHQVRPHHTHNVERRLLNGWHHHMTQLNVPAQQQRWTINRYGMSLSADCDCLSTEVTTNIDNNTAMWANQEHWGLSSTSTGYRPTNRTLSYSRRRFEMHQQRSRLTAGWLSGVNLQYKNPVLRAPLYSTHPLGGTGLQIDSGQLMPLSLYMIWKRSGRAKGGWPSFDSPT